MESIGRGPYALLPEISRAMTPSPAGQRDCSHLTLCTRTDNLVSDLIHDVFSNFLWFDADRDFACFLRYGDLLCELSRLAIRV